jgi:hypothetical protein
VNVNEALDLAIFAINNWIDPTASTTEDQEHLEEHGDEAVALLATLRGAISGGARDLFVSCDEDFMAGTHCSLRQGHEGPHGTICPTCGWDWYDGGHAPTCKFATEDDDDEEAEPQDEVQAALARFIEAKRNADNLAAAPEPEDLGVLLYWIGELEDAVKSATIILRAVRDHDQGVIPDLSVID